MNKDLKVSKSIEIKGSPAQLWDALINPEKIKVYLYGTETITDWQVGSPIVFQGEYEGHSYKDKGNVLVNEPNKILKYNYWSQFSGLDDQLENYADVTYEIEELDGGVRLNWIQQGFSKEENAEHTEKGLPAILEQIKTLVEGS